MCKFSGHTKNKTKKKVATKYGEKKRESGFFFFINIYIHRYMYISTDRQKEKKGKKSEYNIVLNKVNEQQKRRILF
jgi:hypothetical protein